MPTAPVLFSFALLSAGGPAFAQALADPTRPPNLSGLPSGAAAAAVSGPVLQSIVLSPERKIAVISGKLVGIGDRVGDATLVAIDFDSVRLREGRGTRLLKLLPDVRKRETATAAPPSESTPDQPGRGQ